MAKWRVYNRHSHGMTHKEKFKDDMIEIKPGEFVVMDYEDAVQFKGQFFPMKRKPSGAEDPAGFKMIEIVPHEHEEPVKDVARYVCHVDGKEFNSQKELDLYVKENFEDRIFKDAVLDEEIVQAKRRGRPSKEKTA